MQDEKSKIEKRLTKHRALILCCLLHFLKIPSYIKFLKVIVAKKKKINDFETVALMEVTSNVFKNGELEKMIDLRSFTVPCLIGEQVLFSVNFVILDYEADRDVSIILGRSFLSSGRALIEIHQGQLTMHFNDEEMKFNIVNVMKFSVDVENCSVMESLGWDYSRKKPIMSCLALKNSMRKMNQIMY
ncbi:putative lrr receptor-like serinethreonine-protein kinase [Cucumis melo var. makuwa]|uniref:Lrr receptor-like serinethreonine-protein kinase n=1 Tax=Cucumis melo var. makuwa TaxID=1194695 RepID=A0A5D3DQ26_CUCMM|nr:putative lrr receptor-like serinethreonine-protein kinase [Cucumis melo var. makuwa]TYK25767.1 putative lrr receptor-like serinethreonine-protein kinase [Cucumis melo var. makuwa]